MTEVHPKVRNGPPPIWRLIVGGGFIAILVALLNFSFKAGVVAQNVETLQGLTGENKTRSLKMQREVNALQRADAAAAATARATAERLRKIEITGEQNKTALQQNRAALSRIEGLLGGRGSGNRQ